LSTNVFSALTAEPCRRDYSAATTHCQFLSPPTSGTLFGLLLRNNDKRQSLYLSVLGDGALRLLNRLPITARQPSQIGRMTKRTAAVYWSVIRLTRREQLFILALFFAIFIGALVKHFRDGVPRIPVPLESKE
jgi:hypothetical protein